MGVAVRSGTSAALHCTTVLRTKRLLAHRGTQISGHFRLHCVQSEQAATIQRVSGHQLKHDGDHVEALAQVPSGWISAKESLQEPKEP